MSKFLNCNYCGDTYFYTDSCDCTQENNEFGTLEENKEAFDEWFYKIQFQDGMTALLRQVLTLNRKALFETWMDVKPWRFKNDIAGK